MTWQTNNERYIAILDILGLKPPFTRTKAKLEKALHALEESIGTRWRIGPLSSRGYSSFESENFSIRCVLLDDFLILVTRDVRNECLVNLYGSLMRIEVTLLDLGVPLRGAVIKGLVKADVETGTFLGPAVERAFLLTSELQIFGTVFENERISKKNLSKIRKRTGNDIPLEFPTLIPTDTGLKRLSLVNWCLLFQNEKEVVTKFKKIKLKPEEQLYQQYLNNSSELFADAFANTWIKDN